MYVTLVTGTVQPNKGDGSICIWREQVIPTAQQIQGIKGARLLVNHAASTVVSSAAYETEADAQAAGTSRQYQ